jgi:hypothetical protein
MKDETGKATASRANSIRPGIAPSRFARLRNAHAVFIPHPTTLIPSPASFD